MLVGEHDISTDTDGVWHSVACVKIHPDRGTNGSNSFDFSILTLNEPVDITSEDSKARAACLPSDTTQLYGNGELLTVSGWGTQEWGVWDHPSVLHHVQVPGVTNEVCGQDYGRTIPDVMMCAGADEGGIDACQGDS